MSLFRNPSYSVGDRIDIAGAVVRLAVNARARRISLRLDRRSREFVATAPSPRRLGEAAAFALERADWISERLAEAPRGAPLSPGQHLTVFGHTVLLQAGPGRARWLTASEGEPARIIARPDAAFGDRVMRLLKIEAKRVLTVETARFCGRLQLPVPPVAVMDAKGRWGSCRAASPGRPAAIRYSWRLALAPEAVSSYVAAHECAHLLEPNHGPAFWRLVRELYGDPAPARRWLTTNGATLHATGLDF